MTFLILHLKWIVGFDSIVFFCFFLNFGSNALFFRSQTFP